MRVAFSIIPIAYVPVFLLFLAFLSYSLDRLRGLEHFSLFSHSKTVTVPFAADPLYFVKI